MTAKEYKRLAQLLEKATNAAFDNKDVQVALLLDNAKCLIENKYNTRNN